jgi:hypothetical protein
VGTHTSVEPLSEDPDMRAAIVRRVVQVVLVTAFQATILFLAAGQIDWLWAWVLLGMCLAGMAVNSVLLLRRSPETVAERARAQGMKDWDKVVGGSFGVMYFVGVPFSAGLDVRFGWTGHTAPTLHLVAAAAFVLGFSLIICWARIYPISSLI